MKKMDNLPTFGKFMNEKYRCLLGLTVYTVNHTNCVVQPVRIATYKFSKLTSLVTCLF